MSLHLDVGHEQAEEEDDDEDDANGQLERQITSHADLESCVD